MQETAFWVIPNEWKKLLLWQLLCFIGKAITSQGAKPWLSGRALPLQAKGARPWLAGAALHCGPQSAARGIALMESKRKKSIGLFIALFLGINGALLLTACGGDQGLAKDVLESTRGEKKEEKETILSNAYLISSSGGEVKALHQGTVYTFLAPDAEEMSDVVCDIALRGQAVQKIVAKDEVIRGNLLAIGEGQIEIEGYGPMPLAQDAPVYQLYGDLAEKGLDDIVIGNMQVDYVVDGGAVQAALLRKPAAIQNVRVLILNDNSPYREDVRLTADQGFYAQCGEERREYAAGSTLLASELFQGEDSKAWQVTAMEGNNLYLVGEDGGKGKPGYAGIFEIRKTEEGYALINEVPFEEYVCRVLPSEMPDSFHEEALKAQAICARSYAYAQMMGRDYADLGAHLDDGTNYQAYNQNEPSEKCKAAVEDTAGLVVSYQGNVATTYYYSTSCGHTGTLRDWNQSPEASDGYLQNIWVREGQPDLDLSQEEVFLDYIQKPDQACFDADSPYFRWKAAFDFNTKDGEVRDLLTEAKLANPENVHFFADGKSKEALVGFGAVTGAAVAERGQSGAIQKLRIEFDNGTAELQNEYNIRKVLGAVLTGVTLGDGSRRDDFTVLPSAYCTLSYDTEKKMASAIGGGFGHGIGMSQYGANGMAKAGYSCDEILEFFYQGAQVTDMHGQGGSMGE